MAFRTAGSSGPLADFNVTPLVDVMLVLLIIFIVTAPIVARTITVALPQRSDSMVERPQPPPPIELRLDEANQLSWNGTPVAMAELAPRLREQASGHAGNPPVLRIATADGAEYESLARVLAAVEASGLQHVSLRH